jgi:hypothetical protein
MNATLKPCIAMSTVAYPKLALQKWETRLPHSNCIGISSTWKWAHGDVPMRKIAVTPTDGRCACLRRISGESLWIFWHRHRHSVMFSVRTFVASYRDAMFIVQWQWHLTKKHVVSLSRVGTPQIGTTQVTQSSECVWFSISWLKYGLRY